MNPQPKNKPLRDPKYLKWLKSQRCIFTGITPCDPHHLKLLLGGGTGIKPPDTDCIPVSHDVHLLIHSQGELSVFQERWYWLKNKWEIISKARVMADEFYERYRSGA